MKIYHYYHDNYEFYEATEYKEIEGFGLPQYSTKIAPPETEKGNACIFDEKEQKWNVYEDHRGEIVWNISNRQKCVVDWIGAIPDYFTKLEPKTQFDIFENGKWTSPVFEKPVDKTKEKSFEEILADLSKHVNVINDLLNSGQATRREYKHLQRIWKFYANVQRQMVLGHVDMKVPVYPKPRWYDRTYKPNILTRLFHRHSHG
ncbi:distal long tail fiber assembly protein [Citrobacter phage CkP1]|nr:distal long tail fiber assembly protein [Citrobacter phage CkP1]